MRMSRVHEGTTQAQVKVGIVTTWFERGASYVSEAYRQALARRFPVFIYARGGEAYAIGDPRWDKQFVTWGRRVRYKAPNAIDWSDFIAWVKARGITHLIFNEQWTWGVILRCRYELKLCVGAYVDYYTPQTVPFFAYYDFLLCNTKRHHSVFQNHPQALYIPWGTDLETFRPSTEVSDGRNEVVFFHSCGLSPYRKGTDILLRSFRNVTGNARLIIHSQGPLRLDQKVMKEILDDRRVELIEKEQGSPGFYGLGDVYVYPARLDGLGLTVAEALASGLPVIATNAAPMNEFVVSNVNGRLVDVASQQKRNDDYYWPMYICSEEKLTAAMQWYVDNWSVLPDLKLQARRYAEEYLDWNKNSMSFTDQFLSLRRLSVVPKVGQIASMAVYHCSISWRHWLEPLKVFLHRLGAGWLKTKLRCLLRKRDPGLIIPRSAG
jgi:1,2-diacylglycerol 3-alpha-glucosyltransferase